MRFIRAELHNHSVHSDGNLTIEELLDVAEENQFGVLALTDHNTASGQLEVMQSIAHKKRNLSFIPGIEVTTFYGHILALGLTTMIDLTDLNPNAPETFLEKLKKQEGIVLGVAHPFCVGSPISEGCRMEMKISKWELFDYIEIANTSGDDRILGNEKALKLWEELVLSGKKLAPITGKDLHTLPLRENVFVTYAIGEDNGEQSDAQVVVDAILSVKTLVTKGPKFFVTQEGKQLVFNFDGMNACVEELDYLLHLTDHKGTVSVVKTDLKTPITFDLQEDTQCVVIKIYKENFAYDNLLAVSAAINLQEGKKVE